MVLSVFSFILAFDQYVRLFHPLSMIHASNTPSNAATSSFLSCLPLHDHMHIRQILQGLPPRDILHCASAAPCLPCSCTWYLTWFDGRVMLIMHCWIWVVKGSNHFFYTFFFQNFRFFFWRKKKKSIEFNNKDEEKIN